MKPVSFRGDVYMLTDPNYRTLLLSLSQGELQHSLLEQYSARYVCTPLLDVSNTSSEAARALLHPDTAAALDAPLAAPLQPGQPRRLYVGLRSSDRRGPKAPDGAKVAYAIAQLTASGYILEPTEADRWVVTDSAGERVIGVEADGTGAITFSNHMLIQFNLTRKSR